MKHLLSNVEYEKLPTGGNTTNPLLVMSGLDGGASEGRTEACSPRLGNNSEYGRHGGRGCQTVHLRRCKRARSKITRCRLDSWNAVGECPAATQSFCQPLTKRYSLESYSTISYRVIHRVWHGRVTAELCVLESKSRMCGTSVSLGAGGGGGAVSRQRDGSSVCNKLRCRGKPSVCPRRQRHSLANKRQPVDGPRLVEHGYQDNNVDSVRVPIRVSSFSLPRTS